MTKRNWIGRPSFAEISAKLHILLSGCSWEHALVLRTAIVERGTSGRGIQQRLKLECESRK